MNTYAVTAIFSESIGDICGTDSARITVGGYGMRSALLRLLGALADFPALSVCVTDSCVSVCVPSADADAAFSSVCREFQI